jgi:polyisoprenyl-phosphate glycosyltransferase
MTKVDCFVSVVAPIRNAGAIVESFIAETLDVLRSHYTNYELVIVDDASDDDTIQKITEQLRHYECVRVVRLSRSFGLDIAISAGLDSVIGDVVVVLLPHSDPPALIPQIVDRTRDRGGIVFGLRAPGVGGTLTEIGSTLFSWYCRRVLRLNVPKDAAVFRGVSRSAVNALIQIRDRCRYLPILCAQIGFDTETFVYNPIQRDDRPRRRRLLESARLALDIITTTSSHPLRFVTWLGLAAALLNATYTFYVLGVYFFRDRVAEGWTTLSLQQTAMFFLVFLILTVLSEYIGNILMQTENRPLYYAIEERNSVVRLADENRVNVVRRSVDDRCAIG